MERNDGYDESSAFLFFWVEEVGTTLVGTAGIALNGVALFIICRGRLRLRGTLRKLMVSLLAFDLALLVCMILKHGVRWKKHSRKRSKLRKNTVLCTTACS